MLGLLVIGTIGFYSIGHGKATFSDALYMTIITITTVGYSEIVPVHSLAERLFAGFISISGFGTVTFLFTSLSVFFLESDLDISLRRRRMESTINSLQGHYIICGYGRVGRTIGNELTAADRIFVAVEPEPGHTQDMLERDPNFLWLHGDATDDDVLLRAGIKQAAGIFAVTNEDAKNLMISLTAKHLNPNIRVVARCHELRNSDKIAKAGADSVVMPDYTGGMRIVSTMIRPNVVSFLDEMLRSEQNLRMEEVTIPASFVARPLDSLPLKSRDYILVAVRTEQDWTFNPEGSFTLQAGQVLVCMSTPQGLQQIAKALSHFSHST